MKFGCPPQLSAQYYLFVLSAKIEKIAQHESCFAELANIRVVHSKCMTALPDARASFAYRRRGASLQSLLLFTAFKE